MTTPPASPDFVRRARRPARPGHGRRGRHRPRHRRPLIARTAPGLRSATSPTTALAASAAAHCRGIGACKADVSVEADVDRAVRCGRGELGGLDALINNAGIAGPTGGVDEIEPGRLAALHRHLPHRPVPLRPPRRADAEGGRRRLDRQHVVGRRPPRLCLPHALFGGEVRRHRLHPEPRQGARARRTSASTPSCPASSRARAWRA